MSPEPQKEPMPADETSHRHAYLANYSKDLYVLPQDLLSTLTKLNLNSSPIVRLSLDIAHDAHEGQYRNDGLPYLEEHIYPVVMSLIRHELAAGRLVTPELVGAALTHDVPEDSPEYPLDEFVKYYAPYDSIRIGDYTVPELVTPLTKPSWEDFEGGDEMEKRLARNIAYYDGIARAPAPAQLIKCADNLNNVLCSYRLDDLAGIEKYYRKTERWILPIAENVSPKDFYPALKEGVELLQAVIEFKRRSA